MPTALMSTRSAERALRTNSLPALRLLKVHETETVVVITGRVPSYYLKQLAQEAVLPVLRGRELRNDVVVARV